MTIIPVYMASCIAQNAAWEAPSLQKSKRTKASIYGKDPAGQAGRCVHEHALTYSIKPSASVTLEVQLRRLQHLNARVPACRICLAAYEPAVVDRVHLVDNN